MVRKQQEKRDLKNKNLNMADGVEIVYYTDPLCCWSWAFEPQWRRLRYEFGNSISLRYCMAGLIPSWKTFHDVTNSVSRPAQMGPIWMEASHLSGQPIQNYIWMKDPPASSYLSCIAVKCAELQSATAGEIFLRKLREAIMIEGKNIALQSIISDVAHKFSEQQPELFDATQFEIDLTGDEGKEAFRADLEEVQSLKISRYPTLIFRKEGQPSMIVSGHRQYIVLLELMQKIAPDLEQQKFIDIADYTSYWGYVTERELAEINTT
jgi:predicted DsbA family dithiol-disulfide isomerase